MIKIVTGPELRNQILIKRAQGADRNGGVSAEVAKIIAEVRCHGDSAVAEFSQQFGDPVYESSPLTKDQIARSCAQVDDKCRRAIQHAANNITSFAQAIVREIPRVVHSQDGFSMGMEWRPVKRAGCYVPSGRHPLPSTALMTVIAAHVAGVEEIVVVSPRLTPEIVYAATLAGVTEIRQIGGVQAIAVMAYGTETIKPVDMIAGPGNKYVTEAKRQVQGDVGIDLVAGPSEIVIVADDGANPAHVVLDLMAQAEHDIDASAVLLTNSSELAERVARELTRCLQDECVVGAEQLQITVCTSIEECYELSDFIGPEHLHLHLKSSNVGELSGRICGAMFLGADTTVPLGDYIAGPNHTLPTNGSARFTGGLSPLTFFRTRTWLRAESPSTRSLSNAILLAEVEGLPLHAAALSARLAGKLS